MVKNKYVNRKIVTDGNFLYNCATKRILKNDIVKTDIFDVILFGVLSKEETITLPEYLCGHKVQCSSVKPYEKGKKFPEYINGYAFISTQINKKVSVYDIEKYYYAESKYFTLSNINCTKEYIFPKSIHLVNDVLSCNKKVEKIHFNNVTSYIPPSCFYNCTSLVNAD